MMGGYTAYSFLITGPHIHKGAGLFQPLVAWPWVSNLLEEKSDIMSDREIPTWLGDHRPSAHSLSPSGRGQHHASIPSISVALMMSGGCLMKREGKGLWSQTVLWVQSWLIH